MIATVDMGIAGDRDRQVILRGFSKADERDIPCLSVTFKDMHGLKRSRFNLKQEKL